MKIQYDLLFIYNLTKHQYYDIVEIFKCIKSDDYPYIYFVNMYPNIENAYKQQNSNIKAAWYEEKPTFEESLTYRICITSYFHNVFSVNTYNTLE